MKKLILSIALLLSLANLSAMSSEDINSMQKFGKAVALVLAEEGKLDKSITDNLNNFIFTNESYINFPASGGNEIIKQELIIYDKTTKTTQRINYYDGKETYLSREKKIIKKDMQLNK